MTVETFLQPIGEWFGLSVTQLILVVVIGVGLVVGWYVLKLVFRIASKVFTFGCVGILLLLGALYVIFLISR
jgi:ABC-type iron transport system FetAB permease component